MYSQTNNPIQTAATIRTFGQFEDAETLLARLAKCVEREVHHGCLIEMDDDCDPENVAVSLRFSGLDIADLEGGLFECVDTLRKAILRKGGAA